jgi:hypothetical protein
LRNSGRPGDKNRLTTKHPELGALLYASATRLAVGADSDEAGHAFQ